MTSLSSLWDKDEKTSGFKKDERNDSLMERVTMFFFQNVHIVNIVTLTRLMKITSFVSVFCAFVSYASRTVIVFI